MATLTPDLCIIGDSAGGLRAALIAAAFGVPTILIRTGAQDEARLIGKMALLSAANTVARMQDAAHFGVMHDGITVNFARVKAHIRNAQDFVAPRESDARLRALGLHVLHGTPHFESTRILAAGEHRIAARRYIMAPGAQNIAPADRPPGTHGIWTTDTILAIDAVPRRLAIIGGGAEALEYAQAFGRLGATVTVLAQGALLAGEDEEQIDIVATSLRREGVAIHCNAPHRAIAQSETGAWRIAFGAGGTAEAEAVLFCATQQTGLDTLGLAAAGIGSDAGGIRIDRRLRSDNPSVFAIGPCASMAGDRPSIAGAVRQADLVMRQILFRLPVTFDPGTIPRASFTDPEWAAAGLTEAEARARHGAISVLRSPFASNERALAERRGKGHAKLLLDRRGRLLGLSLTGPDAGNLIAPWAGLLGQKPKLMGKSMPPCPSLAETPRRALMEAYAPLARSKVLRTLSALIRRFG